MREELERLIPQLPPNGAGEIEDQTIAVLRLLDQPDVVGAPPPLDHRGCANCGEETPNPRSPYCSDLCKETAAFVRQMRSALGNDLPSNRQRQIALGQKLWHLLGGGYPIRESLVPQRVVAKVIEREGGKCQGCGAPATRIDHTGSG
ncbi:MAG: hypothetical protein IT203_12190 [Fimbriimonadaceae bacterium]|nr:hypothetical protein [Fimbriimonadaceae bacterium]